MIEPEISRRCPDCGASIRERAIFCPQCGRDLGRAVVEEPVPPKHSGFEQADTRAENAGETWHGETLSTAADDQAKMATRPLSGHSPSQPESERPSIRPLVVQNGKASAEDRAHRASAVAREVIEDGLLRVEKFRKASSVVIDQAAYDPSLRFVLVAALLFGIFLVILLINELIG